MIAWKATKRILADDYLKGRPIHSDTTALRRATSKSALALLCCVLATATALAVDAGDWANCQSEDQETNIPACSRILDDIRITGADRLKALNFRARAYLSRHSFVSASRDFGEIIAAQHPHRAVAGIRDIDAVSKRDIGNALRLA